LYPVFALKNISVNLYTSALKIEAACSSETPISTYKTILCHDPEDHNPKDMSCIACKEFNPEDIDSIFLQNVSFRLQESTAS
jgi:hypothetical protein